MFNMLETIAHITTNILASAYDEIGAHFISCSLRYLVLTLAMLFCERLICKCNQIRMTCKRDLHKAYHILRSTHLHLTPATLSFVSSDNQST